MLYYSGPTGTFQLGDISLEVPLSQIYLFHSEKLSDCFLIILFKVQLRIERHKKM